MAQAEKPEKPIGHISHYFSHISVGIIELTDTLRVGEKVHIKGHTTDFVQTVASMEVEHQPVQEAKVGNSVGIKADQHVREGDMVYRSE